MASSSLPLLPRRCHRFPSLLLLSLRRLSTASSPPQEPHSKPPPTSSLSARLSFVFDQLDSLDRERQAKDQALQHLRSWHQSHATISTPDPAPTEEEEEKKKNKGVVEGSIADVFKREVELVHPWPEWIELMERLGGQKYFEFGWRTADEDQIAKNVGIDLSGIRDEIGYDFSRDWITVRNACVNFGRDRFDILRSLARKDLQILVGHGCPSMDPKAVFSAKLLRKYVHLDEGDVCSSCSLRNTCGRGYILTHKEDEARTLDVMRVLLTYGFDHIKGTVENKPLLKMKSVKTVVRKLLHEIVKLSAVPIDPNLSPPVIKKPPPKVKQPPPPPKRRVGRDDIEMKKGDWLCPKCDFMNFAKNTVCLQCDAKRPKRQLLPGEWECPKCDFLNYRRNMVCFHCEHKRPQDEFTENDMQAKQSGPRTRLERASRMSDVTNAWNFDFDDNESDGADVAAFEFADPPRLDRDATLNGMPHGGIAGAFDDDDGELNKMSRPHERGGYSEPVGRVDAAHSSRLGFDDFDDEEDDVDNYELDVSGNNSAREVSRRNFSEFEGDSDLEESGEFDRYANTENRVKNSSSGSEDVGHYSEFEDDLRNHPHWKSSHVADSRPRYRSGGGNHLRRGMTFGSDDDLDSDSDDDVNGGFRSKPRKSLRDNSVRKPTRRGRNADFDDDNLGSEFDDDENPRMRRAGRLDKKGPGRSREFRSDDRMHSRRNSLHSGKDKLSSRGSRRFDRGSGGDRFDKWADNDQIKGFNRGRGRANRSANLSSDFGDDRRRFDRGSGGDQFDKWADNDRIKGFNRGRGRGNRSANLSSDFGDDRPRRRIIER